MSEDSLDSFFAKKDKSKKKGKAKFTSSDLLAKQKEEPKKTKKKREEKSVETQPADGEPASEQKNAVEQEEWTEYAEEKETDYSGLRIQSIQIREDEPDSSDKDRPQREDGDEDDGEERQEGPSGPWAAVPQAPAKPEPEVAPKKEETVLPGVKSGKYRPPGARNQSAAEGMPRSHPRRKKEAPNLQSEEDFPTLGGGPPEEFIAAWGSGARFEKVRSGSRQTEDHTSRGPRLELGNKYDALRGGAD